MSNPKDGKTPKIHIPRPAPPPPQRPPKEMDPGKVILTVPEKPKAPDERLLDEILQRNGSHQTDDF